MRLALYRAGLFFYLSDLNSRDETKGRAIPYIQIREMMREGEALKKLIWLQGIFSFSFFLLFILQLTKVYIPHPSVFPFCIAGGLTVDIVNGKRSYFNYVIVALMTVAFIAGFFV